MSTIVIASAAAVFVIAALSRGPAWPQSAAGWLAVLAIALVSTVAAITLYFAGLERVGPTRAATLSTFEPVVTVTLAALVLGEAIAPMQIAGGALILVAVALLARARGEVGWARRWRRRSPTSRRSMRTATCTRTTSRCRKRLPARARAWVAEDAMAWGATLGSAQTLALADAANRHPPELATHDAAASASTR